MKLQSCAIVAALLTCIVSGQSAEAFSGQQTIIQGNFQLPQTPDRTRVVPDGRGGFKTQQLVYLDTGGGRTVPSWQDVEVQPQPVQPVQPQPRMDRTRVVPDGRGGFKQQSLVFQDMGGGQLVAVWVDDAPPVDDSVNPQENTRPPRSTDFIFSQPDWTKAQGFGFSVVKDPQPEPMVTQSAVRQLGGARQLVYVHYWGRRVLGPGQRGPEKLVCEVKNAETGRYEFWDLEISPTQNMLWQLTSKNELPLISANPPSIDDFRNSSRTSDQEVIAEFRNPTNARTEVFWVDSNGQEQRYAVLEAGQVYRQQSFPGDLWRFKQNGQTVDHYRIKNQNNLYSVNGNSVQPNPSPAPQPTPQPGVPNYRVPDWVNATQGLAGGISKADPNAAEIQQKAAQAVQIMGNRFGNDVGAATVKQILHAATQATFPANYYFVIQMNNGRIWNVEFTGGNTVRTTSLN